MSAPLRNKRRLELHEYTVGWISALPIEYAAAVELLDEEHIPPPPQNNDPTLYTLGQICGHHVVITCLPAGILGIASAATIATRLVSRFPNAKISLMVGIGGGVPSDLDIRLGDVVVSQPVHGHGGVVQYDFGKRLYNGIFERTSHLDKPPQLLLNALAQAQANRIRGRSPFASYLSRLEQNPEFNRNEAGPDRLFSATCNHKGGPSCAGCDNQKLVPRDPRPARKLVQVHYGTIASANSLIKDGIERDRICRGLGGRILCFEMEAAGLMNHFPCLVIRGICDYADSHKNKTWQAYAAATAAAYAKEILSVIPLREVADLAPIQAPWVLPFNRNPQFTGRADILHRLHQCLRTPECHPYVAIHGLGGSGKSAVAIEFAYRARDQNPACAVFWVSSFTVERFLESYRDIAKHLHIPGADDLQQDMLKPVQTRLSGEEQRPWLIIIDNVDDNNVLFGVKINDHRLYDYLPRSRRGMILFTTRNRKIAINCAPNHTGPLNKMEPGEAKRLLQESFQSQHNHDVYFEKSIEQISALLAYLPLAIIQALAFMKKECVSPSEYVELFRETRHSASELLLEAFVDPNRDRESENAVATTWRISFHRLQQESKLAADWLAFSACIAPQNIPRTIFHSTASNIEQKKAIGTLTAYEFFTERTEQGYYDVHPLIHHVTQDWLKDTGRWTKTAQTIVKRLTRLIPPGGHEQSKQYPPYLVHGLFTTHITEIIEEETTIELLSNIGHCHESLGEYNNAVSAFRKVLERQKRTLGLKQQATLQSLVRLGAALDYNGKYLEAAGLHQQALHLQKELLGPQHPDTLTSQANLALTYRNQGRLKEAEMLELQVLETSIRVFGAEHPYTLTTQANLASTYHSQGRWKDAEMLELQVVETRIRVSGAAHPDTLKSQANLALTYSNQGRLKEAEMLAVQVLEKSIRIFGAEHPHTLTTQANLASTYQKQDRLKEAEMLGLQVLETRIRASGAEHPHTLISKANLASTYQDQGRLKEAEILELQVIEARIRLLGAEHPDTLMSQTNLAILLKYQNRHEEAITCMESCIKLSFKTLGSTHHLTTQRLQALVEFQMSS